MAGMITAAVITAGAGMVIANQQRQAAKGAANAQTAAANAGIAEQQRQFDALQALMAPYVTAGAGALTGQQDIVGLNGPEAQQRALAAIQNSPQFQMMAQQGENAILQNASATGGLRGGNAQGSLAQFRPQILSQLIDQQYARLGGITQLGQASAAGQAAQGMQLGRDAAGLQGQIGGYQAGGILGGAAADQNSLNALLQGIGMFGRGQGWAGFGGAGSFGGTASPAGTPIMGGTATGTGGIGYGYVPGTLGGR